MTQTTAEKITLLRQHMAHLKLNALVVPSGDDFLNEYVPTHLNRRQWLSGFSGSAGDMVISQTDAVLFVDGRYHEQVDSQIDTAIIYAEKIGKKDSRSLSDVLAEWVNQHNNYNNTSENDTGYTIGVPATCLSQAHLLRWQRAVHADLAPHTLKPNWQLLTVHPVDAIWQQRPEWLPAPWQIVSPRVSGEATTDRITRIRAELKDLGAEALPITATDQLAWLLNIRSTDIPHTPVALAYGYLTPDECHVFMAQAALTDTLQDYFESLYIKTHSLEAFYPFLRQHWSENPNLTLLLDKSGMPAAIYSTASGMASVSKPSPIETCKAVKNPTELNGMRQAHIAASVALCTAWYQLEQRLNTHQPTSEADFSRIISNAYASHPASRGLSFPSIVGTGENGAIVHYGTPNPNRNIDPGELVLFDSGGQYCIDSPNGNESESWMGTTDTTRTVLAGHGDVHGIQATEKQRHRYTMVLKAHIDTARQRFPKGTNGIQIDAITRSALWQEDLDFLHGTGHGVGCYLGVHEGPIGISKGYGTAFEPGHITSIEPGFYEGGWGGIRLENLVEVVTTEHVLSTSGEALLGFSPLIYVPFDLALIDGAVLSEPERCWLNDYHAQVFQRISPLLESEEHCAWLEAKCAPLHG